MKIIAFGDVHMNLGIFRNIPGIETADLVIITGDITHFGHQEQAASILGAVRERNPNILALAGNLDHQDVDAHLSTHGINLHGRGVLLEEIGLFGVGGANPTPFNTPLEYQEEHIAEILETGFAEVRQAKCQIMVTHAPPLNTKTDRIKAGVHVGSKAVRSCIQQHQPDLCLTGHIHESRGEDVIGRTRIFNPGMIQEGCWIEITHTPEELSAQIKKAH
ncbi:metallophosphoesterase [Thermodesulfobacteriota bacterium]